MGRNKKALKCSVVCFFLFGFIACNGQVDSQKDVDIVKSDVVNFLIKHDELEPGKDLKEYDKRIDISELLDETILGYKSQGIYKIRVYTSHTKQYLLLKDKSKHRILDADDLGNTLRSVVDFLSDQKLSNDKLLSYIEAIIELYKINSHREPVGAITDK